MDMRVKKSFFVIMLLAFATIIFSQSKVNNLPTFKQFLQEKTDKPTKRKVIKHIRKPQNEKPAEFGVDIAVNGSFGKNISELRISSSSIESQLHSLLGLDENYSFGQLQSSKDELGFVHTNYLVYYRGYLLDKQLVMVHAKDGYINSINGMVEPVSDGAINITITDDEAKSIAYQSVGVEELLNEYPVEKVFVTLKDGRVVFASKVEVFSFRPLKHCVVYVGGNGEVVKENNLICNVDVKGMAQTYYNGKQEITCDTYNGEYRLVDNARNIATYNGAYWGGKDYPNTDIIYTNTTSVWEKESEKPALQVHWGMEKTYDYYKTVLGRDSYDGQNGKLWNIYNPVVLDGRGLTTNAVALVGYGMMLYGRGGYGGGVKFSPVVSIDVSGHEFTHLITGMANNGEGLVYENESGALNESFSDIFAVCIDHFIGENPNWTIGEDIVDAWAFMRSLSDPSSSELPEYRRQPTTYKGNYWYKGTDDNGGVHTNSGLNNYWFYLLCNGGKGTNDNGNDYDVQGIGIEEGQKIAFRSVMNYVPPMANHIDAAYASLQATRDLFGSNSKQYRAVKSAWYAVGIDSTMIPCNGEEIYTSTVGSFSDGSGKDKYAKWKKCLWTITAPDGKNIQLSFNEFDLEPQKGDSYLDYVAVYDGSKESGNLIGKYAGNIIPPLIRSKSNMMTVEFISNYSDHFQGFVAEYTVVASSTEAFSVYPSPAVDNIKIYVADNVGPAKVIIYDGLGNIVKIDSIELSPNFIASIDIRGLNSGIYTLMIIGDNFSKTQKFIVK